MTMRALVVAVAVLVLLLAGCGGSGRSTNVEIFNCAPPRYEFEVGRRVIRIGSCAGTMSGRPATVTLTRGERFYLLRMTDPPVPEPSTQAVTLEATKDGEATYRATSDGRSVLSVCSPARPLYQETFKCPVLVVTVRGRPG
jgi:hypothetical protein